MKRIFPGLFGALVVFSALNLQLSTAFAQTAFTYQGRLNDNGVPANGNYDLRFAVFVLPAGGLPQGVPISVAPTAVSNGLFTVTLDFGASAFPGGDRWLEIAVRTNGSVAAYTDLSPRQRLTATPYAIRAANFDGTVSDFQLSTNIARLNANQIFSGVVTFSSQSNSYAGSFAGNGAGLTNLPAVLQWQIVAGTNVQAQASRGYIVTNANQVTITLPSAPNIGDTFRISGMGVGGWKIAQNAGQTILGANLGLIRMSWTARDSNRQWVSVASSADGSKLVALVFNGQIYTSTNSGASWTPRDSSRGWATVASSADGSKLVAGVSGGQIYTSADSGVNWTAHDTNRQWTAVASSADGNKLIAVVHNGQIYTSTNSGANWTPRETDRGWQSVASSADGNKLVAVDSTTAGPFDPGFIYTSTDSGANWDPRATTKAWFSVASSADGSKLVALATSGPIYTSTDSGVTWIAADIGNKDWVSVASSADGSKLVAAVFSGRIYSSVDFGLNWTAHENARLWESVASSADGSKLVAVEIGGQIYTSTPNSTPGTTGYFTGGQSTAIELQYIGNNQFLPLSHEGLIVGN